MKVLYVEMSSDDRKKLDQLAASSGMAAGHPVSLSAVVRQLVRDASKRATPIRVQLEE